jgi:hypothetical protein
MDIRTKTGFLSITILLASIIISVILYFVFHIVFIFVIFIPSVIYYFLTKRNRDGEKNFYDRFRDSD